MASPSYAPPNELCARARSLALRHGFDLVVVFGSRATGHVHRGSDVDVAVRAAAPIGVSEWLDVVADADSLFPGERVDLVDLRRANPLLLHRIMRDAVPLFAECGAFAAASLYAFHRYNDYRPFLRLEREAVRRALGLDGGRS